MNETAFMDHGYYEHVWHTNVFLFVYLIVMYKCITYHNNVGRLI